MRNATYLIIATWCFAWVGWLSYMVATQGPAKPCNLRRKTEEEVIRCIHNRSPGRNQRYNCYGPVCE